MTGLRGWWVARRAKRRVVNDLCAAVDEVLFRPLDAADRRAPDMSAKGTVEDRVGDGKDDG